MWCFYYGHRNTSICTKAKLIKYVVFGVISLNKLTSSQTPGYVAVAMSQHQLANSRNVGGRETEISQLAMLLSKHKQHTMIKAVWQFLQKYYKCTQPAQIDQSLRARPRRSFRGWSLLLQDMIWSVFCTSLFPHSHFQLVEYCVICESKIPPLAISHQTKVSEMLW